MQFDANREASHDEWFIAGTEPAQPRGSAPIQRMGITSPRDGSIFALDPDIPPAAQRITFEGERGTWVLDGKRLGSAPTWRWAPWPGRHELVLRFTKTMTNEIDVFARQARRKPQRYRAVSRGFATTHDE